jgi:hypothetical protein
MNGADNGRVRDARSRLSDPAYFALHIRAARAIGTVNQFIWYDAHFLRRLEVAKSYLADVRPDRLADFVDGFEALKPAEGFRETMIADVFDAATHEAIIVAARAAKIEMFEMQEKENADFGRAVVWDHPYFLELQEQVRGRISDIVGKPLVSSYNFLSRYGADGKCELHMDNPNAMYTFDYCIEQDTVWPIHISRVVDWPSAETFGGFDPEKIIADPQYGFADHLLRPNQALLFNGSSQWHYRRPKTAGGFCHLLFFHYYPAGCEALVEPRRWAAHFAIAELEPLCDLFVHPEIDGLA